MSRQPEVKGIPEGVVWGVLSASLTIALLLPGILIEWLGSGRRGGALLSMYYKRMQVLKTGGESHD
jgi:hypothetical protein